MAQQIQQKPVKGAADPPTPEKLNQDKLRRGPSLGQKLSLVALAFLLLWLGHFTVAHISSKHSAAIVKHANEAGKLRIGSQRIAFLIEECAGAWLHASVSAELCHAAIDLALEQYEASLSAVENMPVGMFLPRDRHAIATALEGLQSDWVGYRQAVEVVMLSGVDADLSRAYIKENADLLLSRAEYLVNTLLEGYGHVQSLRERLRTAFKLGELLLLIVIAFIWRRQVVNPVREMARLARVGDYSARLDYHASDEVGELVAAFNHGNARTVQLLEELALGRSIARRAEAEARSFFDAAADGILISDIDGNIVRINRWAAQIFGYALEELIGSKIENLMPERYRKQHGTFHAKYLTDAAPKTMGRQVSVPGLRKDGSEVPLEIRLSMVSIGEQFRVIAVVRDVTDRVRLEADRQRLLTILDATPDLVAMYTPDQELVYLNPAGQGLLGVAANDLLAGRRLHEMLTPLANRLHREVALPAALSDGIWRGEWDLQDAQGRMVPMSQLLIAHLDEQGQPTHVSAIGRDISEHKRYEAELLHRATHDQLTGLANRLLFRDRLEQAVTRSDRTGKLAALLFIDLDDFKLVNDTLGHAAGDVLLREFANRLQKNLRKGDTRARFGGDEFAVILENISSPGDVVKAVEKLVGKLHEPMHLLGREFVVTTSIGISLYPLDAESTEEFLAHADTAMYRAKAKGRNSYQLYQPEMSEEAVSGS